ncbi:MAG TPA: COX15/CtaA family protein [Candidatus Acidoferrales bacterium]|nr:COX15/CtaA family protein [Candidatus Acidoferrales bacterium]
MTTIVYNKALHRFAILMSVLTGGLLTAGALVTSNDAGLSIPDWPLAYGSMVPPFVGGIRYEFSHRVFAGVVATLTVVLAVWLARAEKRRWVRNFGWIALGTVLAQAVLGGLTVILRQPVAVSVAHACVAQLFFCALVSIALFTSRWWLEGTVAIEDTGKPSLRQMAIFCFVATFLQLVLGAAFRHKGFGIVPHLIGAAVVTGLVFWTAGTMRGRFPSLTALTKCRVMIHALIGTQLLLGIAAWWSRIATSDYPQPMPVMVGFTVAHVVVGAMVLAATVVIALVTYRIFGDAAEEVGVGARVRVPPRGGSDVVRRTEPYPAP